MNAIWDRISSIGITDASDIKNRNVTLSNRIAFIIGILSLITAGLLEAFLENPFSAKVATVIFILLSIVWILNSLSLTNASRFFISYFLPVGVMVAGVGGKVLKSNFEHEFEFYDDRLLLLAVSTIPFILFEMREKWRLLLASPLGLLLLVFYDPIHRLFNVGFYQVGHTSTHYEIIDYMVVIAYLIIVGCLLILKSYLHSTEEKNNDLIKFLQANQHELQQKNESLHRLNEEISERNKEIREQTEELEASQQQIFNASQVISAQREELKEKNQMLEVKLRSRDKSLFEVNTELVKRNNELRQFGYTVSHNLRGPIASLLGLSSLFNKNEANPQNLEIIRHMDEVTKNLDIIIKDLNKIVELKKDSTLKIVPVNLELELGVVLSSIRESIQKTEAQIDVNLESKYIQGVNAYVHSIFYNLINNSIKFQSIERPLQISINSYEKDNQVYLTIEDNGIGFSIEKHYDDIFKLYKTLHTSKTGRGLGLYLVKIQTESIGGEVMVNSMVDKGTVFTLAFQKATPSFR